MAIEQRAGPLELGQRKMKREFILYFFFSRSVLRYLGKCRDAF